MKQHFFIYGLPRSRTSWLANFLSTGNSFCFHEALRFAENLDDFELLMNKPSHQFVGNSDSAMLPFVDEIQARFRDSKMLIVERKPHEVVESLLDFQLTDDYERTEKWINGLWKKLQETKKRYNPMVIKASDLNDESTAREVWSYFFGSEMLFDEFRWDLLDELYINIMIGKSYMKMIPNSMHEAFQKFLHQK